MHGVSKKLLKVRFKENIINNNRSKIIIFWILSTKKDSILSFAITHLGVYFVGSNPVRFVFDKGLYLTYNFLFKKSDNLRIAASQKKYTNSRVTNTNYEPWSRYEISA
jgi:hypothetical protein